MVEPSESFSRSLAALKPGLIPSQRMCSSRASSGAPTKLPHLGPSELTVRGARPASYTTLSSIPAIGQVALVDPRRKEADNEVVMKFNSSLAGSVRNWRAGSSRKLVIRLLIRNARREVLQEAQLMMASATSVRDYTSSDLGPLLGKPQHKVKFLAETVPAYGAISTFNRLRQQIQTMPTTKPH